MNNFWEKLGIVGFWIFIIAVIFLYFRNSNSSNNTYHTTPQSQTNTYWYCWDSGNPSPHHLGHHVYGDHLCSESELGR